MSTAAPTFVFAARSLFYQKRANTKVVDKIYKKVDLISFDRFLKLLRPLSLSLEPLIYPKSDTFFTLFLEAITTLI